MSRKDLEPQPADFDRLRNAVRDAFTTQTPAALAAAKVLTELPSAPPAPFRSLPPWPARRFASTPWQLAAAGVLLCIGLLAGFAFGRSHDTSAVPSARRIAVQIASLDGTVLVRHADRQTWEPLQSGTSLFLGDILHATGQSTVTLSLWDRSSIRVGANTTLSADTFDGRVEFTLRSGTIRADLQSAHPPFFIRTPQGTLEALGTEFTVSVE